MYTSRCCAKSWKKTQGTRATSSQSADLATGLCLAIGEVELRRFRQQIANTSNRLDQFTAVLYLAAFFSQMTHMYINAAIKRIKSSTLHNLHQLLACHDSSSRPHQNLEEVKFNNGQL